MSEFFFDTPWWFPAGLAAVGLVLLFTANQRQEKRLMAGGGALLLAALAAFLVSYFVDTPKERAIERTYGLVAAANAKDWTRFNTLLDPTTSVLIWRGPEQVTDAAKRGAERVGLTKVSVLGLRASQVDTNIQIDISAYSEQDALGRPAKSDWRFTYQNLGDGWRLESVAPLPAEGVSPDAVERYIK